MPLNRLQIFRAGQHQAMSGAVVEFSTDDVEDLAASYDPELLAAPLVKGHPQTDDPAHGWVASLSVNENGILEADPERVDEAFAEEVEAGRFRYISASIYTPGAPGNPTPGRYYLKHVGFLGAARPAVTGLKAVDLASEGEGVELFAWSVKSATSAQGSILSRIMQNLRDLLIERDGKEAADGVITNFDIELLRQTSDVEVDIEPAAEEIMGYATPDNPTESNEGPEMPDHQNPTVDEGGGVDFAAREEALAAREAAIQAREQELQAEQSRVRREAFESFAGGLAESGHISPRHRGHVVAVLEALAGAEPVAFAEGQEPSAPEALFRELLEAGGAPVEFGERFDDIADDPEAEPGAPSFSVPRGAGPVQMSAYRRIQQYAAQNGVPFEAALEVLGETING